MNNNKFRLLVVEDNRADLELTLRALNRSGIACEAAVARDGAEALDYVFGEGQFASRPADDEPLVILRDLKLPLVGGMEVLRTIRGDDRTRRLPVIVLTGSNLDRDITESHQLGVSGYLLKPVDAGELANAIARL
jgi:CheY-like chemotaxis protein